MSFSVAEIAAWTGGRVVNADQLGESLDQIRVNRPAPLAESGPSDLAFFFSREYQNEVPLAKAGIMITGEPFVRPLEAASLPLWKKTAVIACEDPYLAMGLLSEKFAARISTVGHVAGSGSTQTVIHPTAIVHETAEIGVGVQIGPYCVIEERAKIGASTVLYPDCYVGPGVKIGEKCVFFAGVKIYEWTQIGNNVRIHAGSVLGSDGFGYAPRKVDGKVVGHQKIFHLGRVVVGDDVEIGALATVDRGTLGDTVLGNQVKLDNKVHIGHNSRLDEGAVVCGGTCLAGRASLGKFSYIGGLTGIGNAVHVGDGASVGAVSLMTKDVAPGTVASGNPQREYREHFRAHAMLNKLIQTKTKPKKAD